MDTTRVSLIVRIRDANDTAAWSQFVDIYGPMIYSYAARRGLQDADAADLTQEVLRGVSGSVGRFDYDPTVGKFRNWLFAIARNSLSNWLRSAQRKQVGSGDTKLLEYLHSLPNDDDLEDEVWEEEYRRHLFEWVSEQIRPDFAENTWAAFWRTAVDGQKPADVASDLQMSVGSVYVAKNRVVTKLRSAIAAIDDTGAEYA